MADPRRNQSETFHAIDKEAADEAEKRDSRILYEALSRNRGDLGGEAAVPADDQHLSQRILAEARSRSAEIAAGQRKTSSRHVVTGAPIPLWLWAAWILAIAALVAGFWLLR
jgi:hypothetical protein